MNIVPKNGAVLNHADESLIVSPRHANEAAARVFPDGLGDLDASRIENSEFPEGGFGVKLDDLRVITDDGNWAAKGGSGNLVSTEIDVLPLHWINFRLPVVPVVEQLPFRCHRDVSHINPDIDSRVPGTLNYDLQTQTKAKLSWKN